MKQKLGVLPLLVAGSVALLGVGLLTQSAAVGEGVRRGLSVCGGVLIPSLFPFMVLAGILSVTDYGRILSIPLGFLTTRIYKLPRELGSVILLSMIGGYPVGGKMVANLLDGGRIDEDTASRMLCFCVNSGPSFLITAVGVGLFMDRTAGLILFGTQTAATLLTGWLVSIRTPRPVDRPLPRATVSGPAALVLAVSGASTGMIAMCAFAVLFSGLLSLLTSTGIVQAAAALLPVKEGLITAVVSGFLEVTSGCIAAAEVGGKLSFGLTSVIVSFGGLSVLFQIMSCFGGRAVRFRPMILSRLVHACLSTAMALPFYRMLCKQQPVWLSITPPLAHTDSKTTLISVCLMAMCTIFIVNLGEVSKGK